MKLRLDRILTSQGLCSRKDGAYAIKKGRVLFNGDVIKSPKDKIETTDLTITFEDIDYPYTENIYLVLNKPVGYECSDAPKDHPPVNELLTQIHRNRGIMSAGRLDVDTTGLLLFSDDGKFIHSIASPKKHLPKIYNATLKSNLSEEDAKALLKGVKIDNDPRSAIALEITGIDTDVVTITIDEGRYHQVKRMFKAVNNEVIQLHRQKIGNLELANNLDLGQWQYLTDDDFKSLGI